MSRKLWSSWRFKAVNFFSVLLFNVWTKWGFYRAWSRLYRWLYQRRYDEPLDALLTPVEAQGKMSRLVPRADGFKELWDVVGSPHWFQHCLQEVHQGRRQPRGPLDCDEYAFWGAHVVDPQYHPRVLSLVWIGAEQLRGGRVKYRVGGHSVCLVERTFEFNGALVPKVAHIGNWGFSRWKSGLQPTAESILITASPHIPKRLVGWVVWDKDMQVLAQGVGLESLGGLPLLSATTQHHEGS